MFRRLLLIVSLLIGFTAPAVVSSAPAFAVDIFAHNCTAEDSTPGSCSDCTNSAVTEVCQEVNISQRATQNPIIHIIVVIIDVISYIAGAAAIISLIVSGIRLILSRGDSNAISGARNGILYALIGIAVIVLAQAIVAFVLNKIK